MILIYYEKPVSVKAFHIRPIILPILQAYKKQNISYKY